jgi:hypothetical protein
MTRFYVHMINRKWDAVDCGTGNKICPLINEEDIG